MTRIKLYSKLIILIVFIPNIYSQSFPSFKEAFDTWRNSDEIKNNTEIPWNLKIDTIKYKQWVDLNDKNNYSEIETHTYSYRYNKNNENNILLSFNIIFSPDYYGYIKNVEGTIVYKKEKNKWLHLSSFAQLYYDSIPNMPSEELLKQLFIDYYNSPEHLKPKEEYGKDPGIIKILSFEVIKKDSARYRKGIIIHDYNRIEYNILLNTEYAKRASFGKGISSIENSQAICNIIAIFEDNKWQVKNSFISIIKNGERKIIEEAKNNQLLPNYFTLDEVNFNDIFLKRKLLQ